MKRKKFKIKPVEMCIYIDNHAYEPDFDVELIFEYLQDLYYSLSIKKRFFNNDEDYENYSIYSATQAYLRLTNPKQFLDDDDPRKLPRIKSILNWIKRTLYAFKVNYQKQTFNEVCSEEYTDQANDDFKNIYTQTYLETNSGMLEVNLKLYLDKLPKLIYNILDNTPYRNDKYMMHRLYMSSLISLLKSFTLSNEDKDKIVTDSLNKPKIIDEYILNPMYYKANLESPTAFHLNKNMEDYIFVLVNKIRNKISLDIKDLIKEYTTDDDIIENILMSPLADVTQEDEN